MESLFLKSRHNLDRLTHNIENYSFYIDNCFGGFLLSIALQYISFHFYINL